jgi:hypothetical protein
MSSLRKGWAKAMGYDVRQKLRTMNHLDGRTCYNCPHKQGQSKYWHYNRLCHEEKSQLGDMKPKQWQLDNDEEKETQQLC